MRTLGEQGSTESRGSVATPDKKAAAEAGGEERGAAAAASIPDGGGGGKCVENCKSSVGRVGLEISCVVTRKITCI